MEVYDARAWNPLGCQFGSSISAHSNNGPQLVRATRSCALTSLTVGVLRRRKASKRNSGTN